MSKQPDKALTLEQLGGLRDQTEAIARFLRGQLQGHVETLRPLFSPRRVFGKYVGGKEEVAKAETTFTELRRQYQAICAKPFALSDDLEIEVLADLESRVELYPWEYTYEAKSPQETRALTITSPTRWIFTYSSRYSPTQLNQVLAGRLERRPDDIRRFLVNALVMRLLFERYPGIKQLFSDLRYEVGVEQFPGFGALPVLTIRSCLPSFRPADNLLLTVSRSSGVPAFIELIDTDGLRDLKDPLRSGIEAIVK